MHPLSANVDRAREAPHRRWVVGLSTLLLGAAGLVSCSRMGDKPPWWPKEEKPAPELIPVDESLFCNPPAKPVPANLPRGVLTGAPRREPASIQAVIRARYDEFSACYRELLQRAPSAQGRITTRFTIRPGGVVQDVCFDNATLRDGRMHECAAETFGSLRFPTAEAKVTVVYPLMFAPDRVAFPPR